MQITDDVDEHAGPADNATCPTAVDVQLPTDPVSVVTVHEVNPSIHDVNILTLPFSSVPVQYVDEHTPAADRELINVLV